MITGRHFELRESPLTTWLWIGLIGVASIALSRAFACGTPFAAIATLAGFTLRDREAIGLVFFVWISNQIVGFGLLHYPWTASTFAWGAAIGVAAFGSLAMSRQVARSKILSPTVVLLVVAFVAAFAIYELVLFATTWLLPAGSGAFAAIVVLQIFAVNAVALGLLLSAHRAAKLAGWLGTQRPSGRQSSIQWPA